MNYFKNLGQAIKGKGISLTDKETLIAMFGDYWNLHKGQYTGYVSACLNTMGNYFAKAKFRIYRKDKDSLIEIYDHPFLQLLENPNNFQVENELKHYIGEFLGVYGNFYLTKDRGLASGKIRAFYVLPPTLIEPKYNGNGISHYNYTLNGKVRKIMPEDMIHIKYLSSGSQFQGTGLINSIKDVLDIDAYQIAYMKEFYDNGGFLGQVFTTSQNLRPAEFSRVKNELKTEYAGKGNSHKLALFTGGLEPIKSAYSLKDMEMSASRKLTLSEVMTAFRIPQILLGGEGADYNRATAEAAEYSYASTMIEPTLDYIDQVFTKHIRLDYNDKSLVVKHDQVSPKDVEQNLKYYKDMFSVAGLTINDIRKSENYDPYKFPLADKPLINVGGAVIDISTGDQLGQVPNNASQPSKSIEKGYDEEILTLHWKQATRRINENLSYTKRRVDEFFDGQKERLLSTLDLKSPLADTFFDSQDELEIIFNMIENAWMRMFERGLEFGGGNNINDPRIRGYLQQFLDKSKSINETSKNKFKDTELTKENIDKVYEDFKQNRSLTIAETTNAGAFNLGLWFAYKQQGYTHKIWVSQLLPDTRDAHAIAHGQKVKIDDFFNVGGELLFYPSDPNASAENVINCLCVLIGDK